MTANPANNIAQLNTKIIAPFAFEVENLMLLWIDNPNFVATPSLLTGWLEV
jgi:hypothetical protein